MARKNPEIPNFKQAIFETHCHLDYLQQADTAEILERSHALGVREFLTISVSPANLGTVREIAQRHETVFATQGVHPHEAEGFNQGVADSIAEGAADPKVLAIGEIGLDYHYQHSAPDTQRRVFAQQLGLAIEADLPVVIHTREADQDSRAILSEYAPSLPRKGVIHSFTSSPELAEFCLDAGFSLGFNGIITFKNADAVRTVLALTPLDRILLETDAPYLTPAPYRGRENAPYYLPFVAQKMAAVKAVAVSELLTTVYDSSRRLFLPTTFAGGQPGCLTGAD